MRARDRTPRPRIHGASRTPPARLDRSPDLGGDGGLTLRHTIRVEGDVHDPRYALSPRVTLRGSPGWRASSGLRVGALPVGNRRAGVFQARHAYVSLSDSTAAGRQRPIRQRHPMRRRPVEWAVLARPAVVGVLGPSASRSHSSPARKAGTGDKSSSCCVSTVTNSGAVSIGASSRPLPPFVGLPLLGCGGHAPAPNRTSWDSRLAAISQ